MTAHIKAGMAESPLFSGTGGKTMKVGKKKERTGEHKDLKMSKLSKERRVLLVTQFKVCCSREIIFISFVLVKESVGICSSCQ